ncbi:MAG: class I fructose-bisphosphate aldolase [Mycetocola sp.]
MSSPQITPERFEELRTIRARHPERIAQLRAERATRPLLRGDNRLFIVAADHPARGALGVRGDEMAMADRYQLLERLATAISRPGVDGVLGTPDIIDDLAILGLLEDKVVVGSVNRGGLRGASFEMDDRNTGYDIASIVKARLDFAKILLRVNYSDAGSIATIEAIARLVDQAAAAQLPIMLEPFISAWRDGAIVNDLSADAVIASIAITAGLGNDSSYSWLKLPVVEDMERVMASTTLPTLLLGGDPSGHPDETYARWSAALGLPGVHGLVVGRTLLYPADGNVAAAVDTAAQLVHG